MSSIYVLRNQIRERIARWAHQNRPVEFRSRLCLLYGRLPIEEEELQAAIAFAVVSATPEEASFIDQYAPTLVHRSRAERQLLEEWARARFSILAIRAVEPGAWVEVHDVLSDRSIRFLERSASRQVEVGMWLAAFFYEIKGQFFLEGSIQPVSGQASLYAVQAALRVCKELGVKPSELTPAESRGLAPAVCVAVEQASRPPRLVTMDGDDTELLTSTLPQNWDELRQVVMNWPDAEDHGSEITIWGLQRQVYDGNPVVRGCFQQKKGNVTFFTNSRRRHEEMLARWEAATGTPLVLSRVDAQKVPSNPSGTPLITESMRIRGGQSPEETYTRYLDAQDAAWPDTPVPALENRTPRQALADGRRAEVWTLALGSDGKLRPSAAEMLGTKP
jgi:hypothetical protein